MKNLRIHDLIVIGILGLSVCNQGLIGGETQKVVENSLFGKLSYGMTLEEIKELLPKQAELQISYDGGKPGIVQWFTTMWGEYVSVDFHMYGEGRTLNGVVVSLENCERTVMKPSGMYLSSECQRVVKTVKRYFISRYGSPRTEKEPYPGGGGLSERVIWLSSTSKIYFEFNKGFEVDGPDRLETNLPPKLVFHQIE